MRIIRSNCLVEALNKKVKTVLIIKLPKLKEYFRNIFIRNILKMRRFKAEESITIFSEPRGGSTWLMEMLSELLDAVINWEPLHEEKGVVPKSWNFGLRPYIPEGDENKQFNKLFYKIHSFRLNSNWTIRYVALKRLFKQNYVLVKYVRANLLMPYIMRNIKFRFPPIFLLRNPIDTCLSQIKAFGGIKNIDEYPFEGINNERYNQNIEYLKSLESEFELQVAMWCINNCQVIKQLNNYNLHVVFYSDLINNPRKELEKILQIYGLKKNIERLSKVEYRKVSSSSSKASLQSAEKQLYKNFENLDLHKKELIQQIYNHFDFNLYTAFSPYPNKLVLKVKR